eukprot:scaffold36956_cov62-Phaeocystis_antarctica.AAC.6
MRARYWEGVEKRRRRKERAGGPNYVGCCQGTRGAHVKHVLHARYAGRVEAQGLVERRRVLPSRKESIGRGETCGLEGGSAWSSGGGAGSVQGGPNRGGCWQGARGAHPKHVPHVCDARGVPARYVCVELVQAFEELVHACDC